MAYDVASVCIMPYYLSRCADDWPAARSMPSTTIGFPARRTHHGDQASRGRASDRRWLPGIGHGRQHLEGLERRLGLRPRDIEAVIDVAHAAGQKVKVIFENCYLQDDHKIRLCEICSELMADWVKTSTGYGTGGATIEDLKLMRKHAPSTCKSKRPAACRDLDALLEVRAWASRESVPAAPQQCSTIAAADWVWKRSMRPPPAPQAIDAAAQRNL